MVIQTESATRTFLWPSTRPEQERVLRAVCLLLWGDTAVRTKRRKRTPQQEAAKRNHEEFTASALLPGRYLRARDMVLRGE